MLIKIPLRVSVTIGGEVLGRLARARFDEARASGAIDRVVKRVLTETVLQAFRKSVLQALPELLTPVLIPKANLQKLTLGTQVQDRFLKAVQARDRALMANDRSGVKAAEARMKLLRKDIAKRLQRRGATLINVPPGVYRDRVFQVLTILTDPKHLTVTWEGDAIRYQIGDINLLSAVKTPSYIELKLKYKTYPGALMWKQMLYGAGVYSTEPGRKHSAWRFLGLKVKGIRGRNLKVEYANDALGYKRKLSQAVASVL